MSIRLRLDYGGQVSMSSKNRTDMSTSGDRPRRFADSPIRRLMLLLLAQTCFAAMAMAQSPAMIGHWNIEMTFPDGNKRSLHFDAQGEGKGFFDLLDPRAKAWGAPTHFEAKWTLDEGNAVTFSGRMEFMIGNVGRDAGTLMFKGKFESADLIIGEVDFSPLVGERPTRHGTFKATRAKGD